MSSINPLPVPDAAGIYGFASDLLAAHARWQQDLRRRADEGNDNIVEVIAPLTNHGYLIQRRAAGAGVRPLVALEPHHDDLALSVGGYLLRSPRPLTVITIFSQSSDVHPAISAKCVSANDVSALRANESAQALKPFEPTLYSLGFHDAEKPFRPPAAFRVGEIIEQVKPLLPADEFDLIAPASVTRHPDHLLTHQVAVGLGCQEFWDDTAFYPTYASSVDDRHLFELRVGHKFATRCEDITSSILDKITLLSMYQSQMHPISELYRAIRYNWTVASTYNMSGFADSTALYAERIFSLASAS